METVGQVHYKILQSLLHNYLNLLNKGKLTTVRAAQGIPQVELLLENSRLWQIQSTDSY